MEPPPLLERRQKLAQPAFALFSIALTGYCLHFVYSLMQAHPAWATTLRIDLICIGVLGTLLTALSRWAGGAPPRLVSLAAGGLVGALFYFRSFGWAWLDPSATDWLMHGDAAQHYLGWAMFRAESWQWPPGAIESLRYPLGSSVFFTDSNPLYALVLKPFHTVLPTPFQYIGLQYLINWTLLGLLTAATLRLVIPAEGDAAASGQLLAQSLAALLLVLAPVLIARVFHDTLTAHWQIVAAIALILRRNLEPVPRPPPWLPWTLLLLIAALTHLYLLGMVVAFFAADCCQAVFRDRCWRLSQATLLGAGLITLLLLTLWAAGAFTVPGGQAMDRSNIGRWSADALTLINPGYSSRWLPPLPMANPGQWEGWAYLGLGAIGAIVAVGVMAVKRSEARLALTRSALLWLAAIGMYVFALSPTMSAAGSILVDSSWLKHVPLYSVFRSTGRFVWPLHYLLLVVATLVLAYLAGRGNRFALPVLAMACVVQIAEITNPDSFGKRRLQPIEFEALRLHDPRWSELTETRRHIELVPAHGCGPEIVDWLPITELAARLGVTFNGGYVARLDGNRWNRYCDNQAELISQGNRRTDTVYVVHPDRVESFRSSGTVPVECELMDEVNVCVRPEAPSLQ